MSTVISNSKIDPSNTILFVGAGVSTILGLPSWGQLIDEIAKLLGYDPRVFKLLGTPLSLAEFYELEHGNIGPLRSWMDVNWHHTNVGISKSEVHEAIVKAQFRKIYTTNFDRWIERACEHWKIKYQKIVTASDLVSRKFDALEVVKFHGDFDDDRTLVLTETSYFERLDFESPIDMMLRADILRHPVLFIGYSLSDINVRYLFHRLSKVWTQAGLNATRPDSYIFMSNPNPVEEKIFRKWGISPVVEPTGAPTTGLRDFLRCVARSHSR
jgi:hypothetical protein